MTHFFLRQECRILSGLTKGEGMGEAWDVRVGGERSFPLRVQMEGEERVKGSCWSFFPFFFWGGASVRKISPKSERVGEKVPLRILHQKDKEQIQLLLGRAMEKKGKG